MNYISEANKYMYDDNYIVESEMDDYKRSLEYRKKELKSAQQRKDQKMIQYWTHMVQASNKVISVLNANKRREFEKAKSDKAESDKAGHTHEIKMDAYFDSDANHKAYIASAKKHGLHPVSVKKYGMDNSHLQGSKENLEKFIKKHHDDGTGKPEELNHIKKIKK